jgi:hypothetical protein
MYEGHIAPRELHGDLVNRQHTLPELPYVQPRVLGFNLLAPLPMGPRHVYEIGIVREECGEAPHVVSIP